MVVACGALPSDNSKLAIIGGTPAKSNEFTTVVAILRNGAPVCSATIIDEFAVLTAGHCFERMLTANGGDISSIEVFEGLDATKLSSGVTLKASRITLHPSLWTDHHSSNDLAIVETSKPLQGAVTDLLIDRASIAAFIRPQSKVVIAGFGLTKTSPDSTNLTSTNLGIKNFANAWTYGVRGDEIYVGDDRSDTCSGDSGGPALVPSNSGTHLLLAVTARGPSPCADKDEPGTMTLIRSGICWIQSTLQRNHPLWDKACLEETSARGWQPNEHDLEWLRSQTHLDLSSQNIKDISWLGELAHAETIDLSWNHIADVTPLISLVHLRSLDIRGNFIESSDQLDFLKSRGVTVMGERSQKHNIAQTEFLRISSLGAAAGVEQRTTILALREILANGTNQRKSLDLATRKVIGLSHSEVRSLNPLAHLESAEVVLLDGNPLVSDLSPLLTLPRLRLLDIKGTKAEHDLSSQEIMKTLQLNGVTIRTSADAPKL